jgi:hypothetical protein
LQSRLLLFEPPRLEDLKFAMPTDSMWTRSRTYLVFIVTVFVLAVFWTLPSGTLRQESSTSQPSSDQLKSEENVKKWCPLPEKPANVKDGLMPSFLFVDQKSVDLQVKRLSAAVNVPTVSVPGDGDVLTDPRYENFHRFHEVLDDLFPSVYVFLVPDVLHSACQHVADTPFVDMKCLR